MLSLPKNIQEIICKPIDPALIRYKEVQKQSFAYVSGATVCDILNQAFDYNWDWVTEKEWIQESVPYYNKWSKAATEEEKWEAQGPVAHVRGVLTVYFTDENGEVHSISKTGYGAQPIVGKQSEQESAFKGADTDALKKAASRLGIAAELYRSEEEQEFFNNNYNPAVWTEAAKEYYSKQIQFLYSKIEIDGEEAFNKALHNVDTQLYSIGDVTPINIQMISTALGYKEVA